MNSSLQINDPIEVSWTEEYEEEQLERCRVLYEQSEVEDFLDGKEWWASIKVGEGITGYAGHQHGDVTVVVFPAITPGTEDDVEVQYFDGDAWCQPEEEFYHVGRPGTKLRFTNPNGSQTIDLPMNRDMEAVVVQRKSDEIGPAESQATRVEDLDIEVDFYHPAQHVDGDAIQNERVILWLLLEASMDEVPHPAGVTAYAALGELQLKGY